VWTGGSHRSGSATSSATQLVTTTSTGQPSRRWRLCLSKSSSDFSRRGSCRQSRATNSTSGSERGSGCGKPANSLLFLVAVALGAAGGICHVFASLFFQRWHRIARCCGAATWERLGCFHTFWTGALQQTRQWMHAWVAFTWPPHVSVAVPSGCWPQRMPWRASHCKQPKVHRLGGGTLWRSPVAQATGRNGKLERSATLVGSSENEKINMCDNPCQRQLTTGPFGKSLYQVWVLWHIWKVTGHG
jgi:hypothetical protein